MIGPGASKRGTALSPCNLVLKPTSGNTEVRARTSIETTAGEIGAADPGMARLAGRRNGRHRGRDRSRDRQPIHWGGRSSRPHYFGRADSARDRQPSQAAHPATGRRTATPGSRSRQPSQSQRATKTKAARLTAEETTPRAEPRQGYESAPKTAPNRPALRSRAEPATQAPQAMQRAGSKPPQPKHVCQKKWARLRTSSWSFTKPTPREPRTYCMTTLEAAPSNSGVRTSTNWSVARASLAWETGRWLCSRTCWRARPSTLRSRQRYMATQWNGGSQTSPRSLSSRSLQGT